MLVGNASSMGPGVWLFGPPPGGCVPVQGALLCLPVVAVSPPVVGGLFGSASLTAALATTFAMTGTSVGVQTVWLKQVGCSGLSSSAALRM